MSLNVPNFLQLHDRFISESIGEGRGTTVLLPHAEEGYKVDTLKRLLLRIKLLAQVGGLFSAWLHGILVSLESLRT